MDEFVTKDACQRTREAMAKDLIKMDGQIEELMDMKEAIARLTILQEQFNEKFASSFFNTDLGKKIIWGLFAAFLLILLVALDQNVGLIDILLGKLGK